MNRRTMASTGVEVSVLGLCCSTLPARGKRAAGAVLDAACDAGVTLLEMADVDGRGEAEALVGELLGGRSHPFLIATRFGGDMGEGPTGPRSHRTYIRTAVEGSLRRLRTDCIDLYQHDEHDGRNPTEETVAALHQLRKEGKIRWFGLANYEPWRVVDALGFASGLQIAAPISVQQPYGLLDRTAETMVLPQCGRTGTAFLATTPRPAAWAAAAEGDVEGPYGTAGWDRMAAIESFAAERGRTTADVMVSGVLANPAVTTALVQAGDPATVASYAEATTWELTDEDRAALDAICPVGTSALADTPVIEEARA